MLFVKSLYVPSFFKCLSKACSSIPYLLVHLDWRCSTKQIYNMPFISGYVQPLYARISMDVISSHGWWVKGLVISSLSGTVQVGFVNVGLNMYCRKMWIVMIWGSRVNRIIWECSAPGGASWVWPGPSQCLARAARGSVRAQAGTCHRGHLSPWYRGTNLLITITKSPFQLLQIRSSRIPLCLPYCKCLLSLLT